MLSNLVTLAGLGVAGYVVYSFVTAYAKAEGSGFTRLRNAARGSATILVQQLGLVVAGLTTSLNGVVEFVSRFISDQAGAESVKQIIQSFVTPTTVGAALAIFSAVTVWARLRSLGKSS